MRSLLLAVSIALTAAKLPDTVDLCSYDGGLCKRPSFVSYSGLIPVSDNSEIFYWYFVPNSFAQSGARASQSPLVIWLQGGPGSSSMIGALFEIGPLTLNSTAHLVPRNDSSWSMNMPVLFIDSPVGTGWSRTTSASAYAQTEVDVSRDLSVFLTQFAKLHPEAPRKVVMAGESYGGHYIPAVGAELLKKKTPFVLEGVAIGDGLTDPATQVLTKPATAFAFGLIDEKQLGEAQTRANRAHELANAGDFLGALNSRNEMEEGVANASGINLMDVRTSDDYSSIFQRMAKFFGQESVKDLLHIPRSHSFGTQSDEVEAHLSRDVMRSQKTNVEVLLNASVRVLLYQGQFDWKDGAPSNEAWIRTMQWPGASGYLSAPRDIWRRSLDGKIAGYWRRFRNLEQVIVLASGHLVPMDQPESAFDMITKFVSGADATIIV